MNQIFYRYLHHSKIPIYCLKFIHLLLINLIAFDPGKIFCNHFLIILYSITCMPFICGTILCSIPLDIRHHSHLNFTSALSDEQAYFRENCNPRTSQSVVTMQHDSCRIVFSFDFTLSLLIWSNSFHVIFSFHEIFVTLGHLISACTCVRAAQLRNVKDRRDHRVNRGFEQEIKKITAGMEYSPQI